MSKITDKVTELAKPMVEEEGWLQERRDYWFKSNQWESLLK